MKWLLVSSLVLLATSAATAQGVRPAGDDEIATAPKGCWNQERTLEQNRYEERMEGSPRIPYQAWACFKADGSVLAGWIGGDEGMDGLGSYEVSDGKLRLRGPDNSDVWIFGPNELECDVLMSPGRAMKLMNCAGLGPDASTDIPDSSYEFLDG